MNHFIKSIGLASVLSISLAAGAADEFPDGTTIFGYRASGSTAYFYELSECEATQKWSDPGYKSSFYLKINAGWLNEGKFGGYRTDFMGTKAYEISFVEIDWENGELIKSTDLPVKNGFMRFATLNPTTSTIYGYGYNANRQPVFMSAPADNPGDFTVIKEIDSNEMCYGITWNSTESMLAGILADGTLVTIGPDGSQTEVLKTGFVTSTGALENYSRAQPLVWSQPEKVYYWNAESADLESEYLWRIDPADKTVAQIEIYQGGMFDFLMSGETASEDAPEAPELVAFSVADGANSGSVTIKMPTTTKGGSDLSGTLAWKATLDGNVTAEGEAQPGEEVTVDFTDIPSGLHTFAFAAIAGDEDGLPLVISRFIGIDTPSAPQNVELTLSTLTWDAVTSGVNGGYIPADITYEIYINGEKIGSTTETSYAVNLPVDGPLYSVSAAVYAVCGDTRSAAGLSNTITAGAAFNVPLSLEPTAEEATLFATIDGYDDGKTWSFNTDLGQFQSGYNATKQMDEWLVMPPVELTAGHIYTLTFHASRQRSMFDEEYLEVGLSTELAAESLGANIILPKFQVPYSPYDFETYEVEFEAAESAIYRIGFHSISSADMANIYLKQFSLSQAGNDSSAPAEATVTSVVAGEGGALNATVTFKMPQKTIAGEDLDENALLSATVECASSVTVEGKPGEVVSATVETLQGNNTITITVAAGESVGKKTTVDVFTGEAIPGKVTGLTVKQSEDLMSLTLSWDAPTEGWDGGYVNPANITYTVRILKETMMGELWDDLATGLKETSYVFTTEETKLDYYAFAVIASGPSGMSPVIAENGGVLGTPYQLPMSDDFSSSNIYAYEPWITYMPTPDYYTRWGVLPLESVPGIYEESLENALCGMGLTEGCLGMAGFPVFSTEGHSNVMLSATMWMGENAASNISVTGEAYGMTEPVMVGEFIADGDEEWQTFNFELPSSLTDRRWVKLYLNAEFPDGYNQWVVMKKYDISTSAGIIAATVDGTVITSGDGYVSVTCGHPVEVAVYSISGTKIAQTSAATDHKIALNKGLYIVSLGNATYKVAVR